MPQDSEETGEPDDRLNRLNPRERECLELVAAGRSSKEIGRELDVSPNTVDDRIRSACRKLDAHNRTHAAQIYMSAISRAKTVASRDTSILRHDFSRISAGANSVNKRSSAGESDGSDEYDRERLRRLVSLADSGRGTARQKDRHPFAAFFWGTNKLSTGRRIVIILAIALGFVVAIGTVVNGLSLISRMLDAPKGTASERNGRGSENMLKERLAAANNVATQLSEAEAAVDRAIASLGALVNSLPNAQAAVKLSPVVGDAAYGHLQGTVASLFTARTNLVAFHHEMDGIKNHLGLGNFRVRAAGDAVKILEPQGRNDDAIATSGAKAA